jgi:uncharacterized protein involved in response to NO
MQLLSQGHRPFFLAAAAFASVQIGWWSLAFAGRLPPPGHFPGALAHGHAMVFGYTVAVLAGFLAIGTAGRPLLALFALWLAGRLLLALPAPPLLAALVDLAFLPALAVLRTPPLWRSWRWPNFLFLPLLTALALANLGMHLDALGIAACAERSLRAALDLLTLMMVAIGGRLIPGYTRATLVHLPRPRDDGLEWLSIGLVLALLLLRLVLPDSAALGPTALLVAAVLALRLWRFAPQATLHEPLLWILHAGYGWLVLALLLDGLAAFGLVAPGLAVHALGTGAIGHLTQGMMTRIARQHAGLPLTADRPTRAAFALIVLAATVRVGGPLLAPALHLEAVLLAGGLWAAAFLLFLVATAPALLRVRRGRAGTRGAP